MSSRFISIAFVCSPCRILHVVCHTRLLFSKGAPTGFRILALARSLSLSLPLALSRSLALSLPLALSRSLALSFSLSLSLSLSPSLPLSLSPSLPLSLSLCLWKSIVGALINCLFAHAGPPSSRARASKRSGSILYVVYPPRNFYCHTNPACPHTSPSCKL